MQVITDLSGTDSSKDTDKLALPHSKVDILKCWIDDILGPSEFSVFDRQDLVKL